MLNDHPAQIIFTSQHPLTADFDLTFIESKNKNLTVTATVPPGFATDDGTNAHTGFTTIMLDTVMGSSVFGELGQLQPIATIKLTVDHNRLARIGEKIVCKARFDGENEEIAYVSAEVRSLDDEGLIATALGTFMIGTRARPLDETSAGEPV